MKTCLVKLTLVASGAVLASHAFAQSSAEPADAARMPALKAPASAPSMPVVTANAGTKVAVNARSVMPTAVTSTVLAAGSVLLLADGIVANAALAQIQPPAIGFVYER
jgi:hypothetical protein